MLPWKARNQQVDLSKAKKKNTSFYILFTKPGTIYHISNYLQLMAYEVDTTNEFH
jgi:hypothetical protein